MTDNLVPTNEDAMKITKPSTKPWKTLYVPESNLERIYAILLSGIPVSAKRICIVTGIPLQEVKGHLSNLSMTGKARRKNDNTWTQKI